GGGFVCIDVDKTRAKMAAKQQARAAATGRTLDATASGYCNISGCWDVQDQYNASYEAVGAYYWKYDNGAIQKLGDTHIDFSDRLTGTPYGVAVHRPFCWSSTSSTANVYGLTERYSVPSVTSSKVQLSPRVFALGPNKTFVDDGLGYCFND